MNAFLALILFMFAVAFFLRVDFIYYIIYVCVGIYAWAHWYVPRSLKKVQCERVYNDHAFWGETVPVTIRINNPNRLSLPWLYISESVAVQLRYGNTVNDVITLPRRKITELTYQVAARKRGFYRIGPMRLATGDLFGIQPERHASFPAGYLTVYPRITSLTQLGLPSRLPFGTVGSRQRLFEDPSRPMGVRDFRSGDTIRQINWKASAHTQSLMVKTHQPAISLETAVLLDLHTDSYRRPNRPVVVEWAIQVAASLAAHLIEQRQPVGLQTNGVDPLALGEKGVGFDEETGRLLRPNPREILTHPQSYLPPAIPPRNGRAHLIKILERLARVESENTIPFTQWANQATLHLSWGVTILVITAKGTIPICEALHRMVQAGYNPVLIVVEPDANFSDVRQRAKQLGFAAFNIVDSSDLDPWRKPHQTQEVA